MKGNIYLIPTSIGDTKLDLVLPNSVFEIINQIDYYIVENIRTARRFLKKAGLKKEIDDLTFYTLNKYTKEEELSSYLAVIEEGKHVGIISEAGVPGVADPGADIVKIAHQKNYRSIPLVGPSSILLALMASGLNGQNFAFNGYLPINKPEKIKFIKKLEGRSKTEKQTQIFIEAPYRNMQLLNDFLEILQPSTQLCIACDITLEEEYIKTYTVQNWKQKKLPELHKKPAIFLFLS